jgi:hypothetical protein
MIHADAAFAEVANLQYGVPALLLLGSPASRSLCETTKISRWGDSRFCSRMVNEKVFSRINAVPGSGLWA